MHLGRGQYMQSCLALTAVAVSYMGSTISEVCWPHQYTGEWTFLSGYSPIRHFRDNRVRQDTTRSASAALDVDGPIIWAINSN